MAIEKTKIYTVRQAALELGKSEASVRRLLRQRQIPSRSEGRRLFILGSDLLRLGRVRPKPTEATPPPPPIPDSPPPAPPPPDSRSRIAGRPRISPTMSVPEEPDDDPIPRRL